MCTVTVCPIQLMMRIFSFIPLLLTAFVLAPQMRQVKAVDFGDFLPLIISTVFENSREVFLGYDCLFSKKPTFEGIEIVFVANFSCPEISAIKGEARTKSNSKAKIRAIQDYIKRAVKAGVLTKAETDEWLRNNS